MHMPNREATYETCYHESIRLVARSLYDIENTIEDVRGLCIAASWLPKLSWELSGQAFHIATELGLHTVFSKQPNWRKST
jgi:hypothetical protein